MARKLTADTDERMFFCWHVQEMKQEASPTFVQGEVHSNEKMVQLL
jgi:hypothetical protein